MNDTAATSTAPAGSTPRARYAALVSGGLLQRDPAQERVIARLQTLHEQLLAAGHGYSGLTRLRFRLRRGKTAIPPVRGVYLWGSVGRGKTFLADLFFDCLPFPERKRMHFHRFMQDVHDHLASLGQREHPLELVADRLARGLRVICFDELFVSDIADAMILGTLFEGLFRRGVTLVATSNVAPGELYKDGLQRARFLPTIALLERHTDVISLEGAVDYRLRVLEQAEIYHSPLDAQADANLRASFDALAPDTGRDRIPLRVNHRDIPTRRLADGVVWFDFDALCRGPRSPADYIEIARCHHSVLVSGIPVLDAQADDEARRFIAMVDEFYDRNVKLIVSAAAPADALYRGERLSFEFARTASRLVEMQSREYLTREHLP